MLIGFLVTFISLKILQYLKIISKLWILDIVRGLLRAFFLFGVLFNFRINYGIEICKISKLVMYLNSCSTDLGRDIIN